MKYATYFKAALLIAGLGALSVAGCKKNDSPNNTTSNDTLTNADDKGGYAADNAKMEQISNDVISIADAAGSTYSASNLRTTSSCAIVTVDTPVGGEHRITIDFGATGCTGIDGKVRKGKIIVDYGGHYKDSGSIHTITYDNYFINGNQLTGNKTVVNEGRNSSGQYHYSVDVYDTLILSGGAGKIAWVGARTRTWLAGYGTPDRTDDVYQIDGTTTLTRANGNQFVLAISPSSPLKVALSCLYIESGVVDVTGPAGDRTLDYGDGTCDNKATLTIDGTTYNITLLP